VLEYTGIYHTLLLHESYGNYDMNPVMNMHIGLIESSLAGVREREVIRMLDAAVLDNDADAVEAMVQMGLGHSVLC